jgi:hypothetical protein
MTVTGHLRFAGRRPADQIGEVVCDDAIIVEDKPIEVHRRAVRILHVLEDPLQLAVVSVTGVPEYCPQLPSGFSYRFLFSAQAE